MNKPVLPIKPYVAPKAHLTFPTLLETNLEVAEDPRRKDEGLPWRPEVGAGILNLRARGPGAGSG